MPGSLVVARFSECKRHIAVLDHMLDLPPHCASPCQLTHQRASTPIYFERRNSHLLVKLKSIMKYTTNTGQNTGTLNTSNHVARNPSNIARVLECQNLNSGNRRMKGRNSSSCFVGSACSPSSIPSSWDSEGSIFGCRKARNWFRW